GRLPRPAEPAARADGPGVGAVLARAVLPGPSGTGGKDRRPARVPVQLPAGAGRLGADGAAAAAGVVESSARGREEPARPTRSLLARRLDPARPRARRAVVVQAAAHEPLRRVRAPVDDPAAGAAARLGLRRPR